MIERVQISPNPIRRPDQLLGIPYSDEALQANLQRLESAWEEFQSTRDRDAVYGYLTAVFDLVQVWETEGHVLHTARRALRLNGADLSLAGDPMAAVIFCTSDPKKVDRRTRSKWSRVLRYAAQFKLGPEPLGNFIRRKGGINKCASRYARCLGRTGQRASRITGSVRRRDRLTNTCKY